MPSTWPPARRPAVSYVILMMMDILKSMVSRASEQGLFQPLMARGIGQRLPL
jgi:hypothetical protein